MALPREISARPDRSSAGMAQNDATPAQLHNFTAARIVQVSQKSHIFPEKQR
jgi:hypothetical protein